MRVCDKHGPIDGLICEFCPTNPPAKHPPPRYLLRRILEKGRLTPGGCIEFNNGADCSGYSRIQSRKAHRSIWEWLYGALPDGAQIDHLCRNRLCINPEHLEPVSSKENTLRGDGPTARNARADTCPLGHAYAGANLVGAGRAKKWRACHICRQAKQYIRRGGCSPRFIGKIKRALAEHVARVGEPGMSPATVYFEAVSALKAKAARSPGDAEKGE